MARQAGNDGDINRLNETSRYAGTAEFERPRLLFPRRVSHTLPPPDAIVPYLVEAGFSDTVALRDFTFDNFLISVLVERWHPETHMFHLPWGEVTIILQEVAYHLGLHSHGNPVGGAFVTSVDGTALRHGRWWSSCLVPGHRWRQSRQSRGRSLYAILHYVTDRRISAERQVQQPGARTVATTSSRLRGVQGAIIGLCYADLDLPVTLFSGTAGSHGYRRLHSATDELDLPEIFPVVSTSSRVRTSTRPWSCSIRYPSNGYGSMSLHRGCTTTLHCRTCANFGSVRRQSRSRFNGEQLVPRILVNLDRHLTTTGRSEDVWWPERLQ
ncbi:uncharacterized protein DS421_3g83130 [Arachis hypogaea]|nr:uncharacterized protein DS421_3g83130 [Arachis hypogaea]